MEEQVKIEVLAESLKVFVTTNCELLKMQAIERSAVIGSAAIAGLVVMLTSILFILFISLGLCFYLSDCFDDHYSGFAIVGAFYFLLSLILIIGRKKFMANPIRDKIIKNIFSKNVIDI